MAKTTGRKPPSVATRAARAAFNVPAPKGANPGPIPRSMRYVAPSDPEEEAAFASATGRSGQRGRASAEGMAAARTRMGTIGLDIAEQDGEDFELDSADAAEIEQDEEITGTAAPMLMGRAPQQRQAFSPFAPQPQAAPPQPARDPRVVQSTSLTELLVTPTNARDVDRLWDWIRADTDGGQQFLGQHFSHSQQLHALVQQLVNLESNGIAIFRSLLWGPRHFGFLMLSPILAREQTALCHIYLEAEARGGFDGLVGPLVAIAEQLVPNMHLAFYSPDANWERVYSKVLGQLSFRKHAMFIR